MKTGRIFLSFLIAVFLSIVGFGGEISNLIQFQPNTRAKSSEVNQNFNSIKSAVNDNNNRIESLEVFKENVAGSSCSSGNSVIGFSSDGTLQCEDMNKGTKILSVTYSAPCFATVNDPQLSLPKISSNGGYVSLIDVNSQQDSNSLYCSMTLPEGSKILKIIAKVYDGNTSGSVTISLEHLPIPGNDSSVPHTTLPSTTSAGQSLILDFSSDPEPVERGASYVLKAYFSKDTALTTLSLYRVVVIYEYDPKYSGSPP